MVAARQPNTQNPAALMAGLLDRGYTQTAGAVLNAITTSTNTGLIDTRLNQLQEEAAILAGNGRAFTADNPVLRAVIADLETVMPRNTRLIADAAPVIQGTGVQSAGQIQRVLAFPGITDQQMAAIGFRWNNPNPEAINAVVQYARSDAWRNELSRYGANVPQQVLNVALRGIINGQNPVAAARDVRLATQSFATYQANTLMRTMQLTAYRDATALHQRANADISQGFIIRIAALDDRTCLACIALNGEEYPVGTRIDDHHNGRCTSILKVRGRSYNVMSGEAWLAAQPETRQRAIMGHANYEAWKANRVNLRDFVHVHNDPVFGQMIGEASLKGILGDQARQFYRNSGRVFPGVDTAPDQIATMDGYFPPDVGTPGNTLDSMNAFLRDSNGALAFAMGDPVTGMLSVDWSREDDYFIINRDVVQREAAAFVRESQDIQYGRDYILALARDQAAQNGVTVDGRQVEQMVNRQYANRAEAILTLARIDGLRLTEAQLRRLQTAANGGYLDMVYAREGSESGSIANAVTRNRREGGLTGAQLREARANFREWVQGYEGQF